MEILQWLLDNAFLISFESTFGVVFGILAGIGAFLFLAYVGILVLGILTSAVLFIAGFFRKIYLTRFDSLRNEN